EALEHGGAVAQMVDRLRRQCEVVVDQVELGDLALREEDLARVGDPDLVPRAVAIPTSILIAPDSFKGTFTAVEVATAAGRGLQAGGRDVDLCPVADGGEGTLAALMTA